jgi:hypothetical protein
VGGFLLEKDMDKFQYEAEAKDARTLDEKRQYGDKLERLGVWTDGLSISSEYEPGWAPAFRFKKGEKYRITIEKVK